MTSTARTRTPGKSISLVASLTVVLAGVSGIAMAASAAAEPGKGKGQGQAQSQDKGNSSANGNAGGNGSAGGNAGGNAGGAKPGQEVCGPLDSGKIDYSGGSVTVPAPDGFLISGYCVKAGSDQSTSDGAVSYVTITPVKSVTFSHYSGKSISHYSVSYTPVVEVCVDGVSGTYGEGDTKLCAQIDGPPADQTTPGEVAAATLGAPEAITSPEAATVTAPQAATVPVNAKAPATVAVPTAATVPAAVPAGDGSQVPGLPMWALALVAVGMIGAAAAGTQLLKNN